MANFSRSDYHLEFNADYTSLVVKCGTTIEASFNLEASNASVYVGANATEFVIQTSGAISGNLNKYDVDGGTTLNFEDAVLGGIGMIDLRDMGRVGNFGVTYNLPSCSVQLYRTTGPFSLWVKPAGDYSYQEN